MAGPFVPLLHHFAGPPTDLSATPEPAPRSGPLPPPVDLDRVRQEAYDAGLEDGRAELAPRVEELEAEIAAARALVPELDRARKAALVAASEDVAAIVSALVRRIVGDSLALHPDALPGLVRAALERLPDEDEVWIRVPEGSVEHVASTVPERHRSRVKADPTLSTGCVVETRHVSIDASLDTALAGIAEATQLWLASQR